MYDCRCIIGVPAQVSTEIAADVTPSIQDDASAVLTTSASATAAGTLFGHITCSPSAAADLPSCTESVSTTEVASSTAVSPSMTRRSTVIRSAQSATVLEEPASADEELQCSECKKSFRSPTLLDYHKKYYHHVAVSEAAGVTTRRTSLPTLQPSSSADRTASGRFRSKNKSMCKSAVYGKVSCCFLISFAPCGLWELWLFVKIDPVHFLAGCRKRQLNEISLVSLGLVVLVSFVCLGCRGLGLSVP